MRFTFRLLIPPACLLVAACSKSDSTCPPCPTSIPPWSAECQETMTLVGTISDPENSCTSPSQLLYAALNVERIEAHCQHDGSPRVNNGDTLSLEYDEPLSLRLGERVRLQCALGSSCRDAGPDSGLPRDDALACAMASTGCRPRCWVMEATRLDTTDGGPRDDVGLETDCEFSTDYACWVCGGGTLGDDYQVACRAQDDCAQFCGPAPSGWTECNYAGPGYSDPLCNGWPMPPRGTLAGAHRGA